MRSALLGLAAVMSLCTGPVAQANTPATANMSVTLTIFAACTVSATTLAFPQLAATTQSTVTNQTATVSVTCASGVPYAIGMGQGLNYSTTNRMVYATSNYIAYALYTDSGHSIPWLGVTGTACTTSSDCSVGTGTGSVQTITVYGQVPVLGSAPAVGSYTDTVTLTVDY
jgi:spore coat protein U-like protein